MKSSSTRTFVDIPVLQSPLVVLHPLVAAHASSLFDAMRDTRTYEFIADEPPSSVEDLECRFGQLEARRSPDGSELWLNWAVQDLSDATFVGYVQATVREANAEIAYVITPTAWGRSLAYSACWLMIGYLQRDLGVATITAQTDASNQRSIRLLRRLDFLQSQSLQVVLRGTPRTDLIFIK